MPVRRHRWQYGSRHSFQFGPLLNSGLFSSHWLENRLSLEPEWQESKEEGKACLAQLADLWRAEKPRVGLYGDEDTLRRKFIDRVLELLGWKIKPEAWVHGREPDYAMFAADAAMDAALLAGRTSPDFWKYPVLVGEAKAWDVPLDRPSIINGTREYPPEQIEWYLNHSRLDFGILTNGRLWRLVPRTYEAYHRRFEAYLQADLAALLDGWIEGAADFTAAEWYFDEFLPFYLFFGPRGFSSPRPKPLVRRAIEGSAEYRLGIGEDLRERAFEALRLCISGYLHHADNHLDPAADLEVCRENSLVFLYRLLFVMFAEDRGLLPYRTNNLYTANRCLARHRDEIAGALDRFLDTGAGDYSKTETAIWEDLQSLFDLIDRGHARYRVAPFNGGLFDPEQRPFLSEKRVPDWWMARVIDHLSRAKDAQYPALGLCRVDYRDLAIQHLGGVYEGLLEVHPRYAPEPMMVVRERTPVRLVERTVPVSQGVPRGFEFTGTRYEVGAVYLETSKGERRASGSYYTPDHIVTHIVEQTLGPLCKRIAEGLQAEIALAEQDALTARGQARRDADDRLAALREDYGRRVLRLRVLDPAMGSGHFLLRACQFLAEEIATHPNSGEPPPDGGSDESAVTYWKRRVVECCLYGVDLNPMAVELAAVALWLETVAIGRPLTFLSHHVRPGNSLIGARIAELGVLPGEIELRGNQLKAQLEEKLPLLLEPLEAIRVGSSDRLEDVKGKDKLYRALERARQPFRDVADLWCSTFAESADGRVTEAQYDTALDALGRPRRFAQLAQTDWFRHALRVARREDLRPFQWELEFPEAFFQNGGRRPDAGFDAVLGNPPYDVLSERETGRSLGTLRAFIAHEPVYGPSQRGKNNLYKLFICRALELLADGGHFSFITPMALLGDDQAADLRREMVRQGAFTGIEAFPQKDDPAKRVFPEAKLSTAVFAMRKGTPPAAAETGFRARVHPGATIEPHSPGLLLTTEQIPLYDPSNCGIVSCSQADWDLATRIMQTGRMVRLKDYAEFFQGEVNETNERNKGNLAAGHEDGTLVNRGAGICLYVLRPESQGKDLYINVDKFLEGKAEGTKAFHHRQSRVGLQESCPQNNFRRIIAAFVPRGRFLNHKVNYCPEGASKLDLRFLLGLLNSRLADWYFRLGSTNASVSHYQLYNLPCPRFTEPEPARRARRASAPARAVAAGDLPAARHAVEPMLQDAPFPLEVQQAVIAAVERIIAIEAARENMARKDRSALHPDAQPYQDFIDRLFYRMAGLTDAEAAGLEERLARML